MPGGDELPGRIEVRWLSLDLETAMLRTRAQVLEDDESARIAAFATAELRQRAAARLVLRREVLAQAFGVPPAAVELHRTASGQPFAVAPDGARVSVSASSRGDVALLAYARDLLVGVDLEALDELGEASNLARRIGSAEERAELEQLSRDERRPALLRLWVRKEAYLKATGEGIGAGLTRVTVPLAPAPAPVPFQPDVDGAWWVLFELPCPVSDHAAALVVGPLSAPGPLPEVHVATS